MPRHRLCLESLVTLRDALTISPQRFGVPIKNSGIKPFAVLPGQPHRPGEVGGIMRDLVQRFHGRFLGFKLLLFVSEGDAR